MQGNGSSVAHAITDAVLKHTSAIRARRCFLHYAPSTPALTNEKCHFWHFRFDADVDMKMAGLTDFIAKDRNIPQGLPHQPGLLVRQGGRRRGDAKMLAASVPTSRSLGDELHPLQKEQDFSPTWRRSSIGADSVITGNWSNDMLLLFKAGKDAGLNVNWFTYYGGGLGSVPAIGKDGVGHLKHITEHHKTLPTLLPEEAAFTALNRPGRRALYWRLRNLFVLLEAAAKKAGSNEPAKLARALEGMKMDTPLGPMEMRADNHQLLQPLFVSTLSTRRSRRRGERPGLRHRREDRRRQDGARHDLQDAAAVGRLGPRRRGTTIMEIVTFSLLNGLVYGLMLFHAVERAHAHPQHDGRAQLRPCERLHAGRVLFLAALALGRILAGARRGAARLRPRRRRHRALRASPRARAGPRRRDPLHLRPLVRDRRDRHHGVGRNPIENRVPAAIDFSAFHLFGTSYPFYKALMVAISVGMFASLYFASSARAWGSSSRRR